jgi:hypothetical protein
MVYLPGPLTRELFYVRHHIVNSAAGGCVLGDDHCLRFDNVTL